MIPCFFEKSNAKYCGREYDKRGHQNCLSSFMRNQSWLLLGLVGRKFIELENGAFSSKDCLIVFLRPCWSSNWFQSAFSLIRSLSYPRLFTVNLTAWKKLSKHLHSFVGFDFYNQKLVKAFSIASVFLSFSMVGLRGFVMWCRYLKSGPGNLEREVERRFSYALSREDVENAILGGP